MLPFTVKNHQEKLLDAKTIRGVATIAIPRSALSLSCGLTRS